jgi:hypothetical protein
MRRVVKHVYVGPWAWLVILCKALGDHSYIKENIQMM